MCLECGCGEDTAFVCPECGGRVILIDEEAKCLSGDAGITENAYKGVHP